MASLQGFDASKVEPSKFSVLPADEYDMCIVASTMKPTSKGDGKYLELELQVLSGEFQNFRVWDRLNLVNPSAKATEIAKGTLSAICRAVGVLTPSDSSELHNKPLRVKVTVRKSEEYGEQNEIKAYKPRNGQPAQPAAPQAAASPWPMNTATPSPAYQETARQAGNVF